MLREGRLWHFIATIFSSLENFFFRNFLLYPSPLLIQDTPFAECAAISFFNAFKREIRPPNFSSNDIVPLLHAVAILVWCALSVFCFTSCILVYLEEFLNLLLEITWCAFLLSFPFSANTMHCLNCNNVISIWWYIWLHSIKIFFVWCFWYTCSLLYFGKTSHRSKRNNRINAIK